jgi:3-oxoacyl-[acyl-carrier protein] reductase
MTTSEKVIFVTGGSRGLGLALAQSLLGAGYAVVTCSRSRSEDLENLLKEHPQRLLWLHTVLGDEASEAEFIAKAVEWAGGRSPYGLVNNAAISGEGIFATYPNRDLERILQVNLLGTLRVTRLFLRTLLARNIAGRIINISSIIGSRGYTGLAAYAASKAGLDGATRALAREVGRRGITVNSVAPGYLETAMSASLEAGQRSQIVRRTPLGRLGKVSDVTPVVRFLLSDEAGYITGQTMVIDGGITC